MSKIVQATVCKAHMSNSDGSLPLDDDILTSLIDVIKDAILWTRPLL